MKKTPQKQQHEQHILVPSTMLTKIPSILPLTKPLS
jgi:hypothetical protein